MYTVPYIVQGNKMSMYQSRSTPPFSYKCEFRACKASLLRYRPRCAEGIVVLYRVSERRRRDVEDEVKSGDTRYRVSC